MNNEVPSNLNQSTIIRNRQKKQSSQEPRRKKQVQSSTQLISKRIKDNYLQYLVIDTYSQHEEWISCDKLSEQCIEQYEKQQQLTPTLDGRKVVAVVHMYLREDIKYVKVQMHNESELSEYLYTYVRFHIPRTLLQYVKSIYTDMA